MREQIDQLEEQTQALEKKGKIILALFIPLAVIGLFYYLYLIDAMDEHQNNIVKLKKLKNNSRKYSVKRIKIKIKKQKQKNLHINSNITENEQKVIYFDTQLRNKNFLFISPKDFNIFLNDLLYKSVKNNFLLTDVNISKKDSSYIGKLKYKKIIHISGSGEFLNTLRFIRGIEENHMLMQIVKLNIETNGMTPFTTFDINFYGIKR